MALEGGSLKPRNERLTRGRFLGLPKRHRDAPGSAPHHQDANPHNERLEPVLRSETNRPESTIPKASALRPLAAHVPAAAKVTKEAGIDMAKTTAKGIGKVGLYATAVAFVGYIWSVKWLTDKSVAGLSSILDSFYTNGKEGASKFFAGIFGASGGGGGGGHDHHDHHDDHHDNHHGHH